MNHSILFLFSWLLCLMWQPLQARKSEGPLANPISFRQLSQEDGLSQSNITDIIQDRRGFMWIATEDGLNRYDGYTFLKFHGTHGLPNDQVTVLLETQDGMIWIGTRWGGLAMLDPATLQFAKYAPNPGQAFSLRGESIKKLYEDREGRLWVGTFAGGLQYLDRATGKFYSFPESLPGLHNTKIYGITEETNGRLWAGTAEGLYELEQVQWSEEGDWTGKATRHHLLSNPEDREVIYSLSARPEGGIWMNLWDHGLMLLDIDKKEKVLLEADPTRSDRPPVPGIYDLMTDRAGDLWLCNFDGGLSVRDKETGTFTNFRHQAGNALHLSSDYTTCVLEDKAGALWVGTFGGGLNVYSPYRDKFALYQQEANNSNSLSHNQVFGIQESQFGPPGVLWIGTHGNGLNLKLPASVTGKEVFRHFAPTDNPTSLSYKAALCLTEDRAGNLWVGTYKGLNKLSADQVQALVSGQDIEARFERFFPDSPPGNGLGDASVWSILLDRQGRLWIGTAKGLYQYLPNTEQFVPFWQDSTGGSGLSHLSILTLFQDSKDRLWLGTAKGLNVLERIPEPGEPLVFTQFLHDPEASNGMREDWVYQIGEDDQGRIWMGTRGGGLHVLEEKSPLHTSSFRAFGEKEGMPDNSIRGIAKDAQGSLWISTKQGLCTFHPDSLLAGNPSAIRTFDNMDGLQGIDFNEGSATIGRDGRMFFGGMNGFNAFYPGSVQKNPHAPNVYVTGIRILDRNLKVNEEKSRTDGKVLLTQDLPFTEQLRLSYQDYSFTLFFSALDYSLPEKNQYAYKLEGFDDRWRRTGTERMATYTNLDPGTYTFRIRASNNDGVWNTEEQQIRISVSPPPWKSWWALTLYILAVLGAFYGYLRFQIREQEKEFETVRQIEKARQDEREHVRKRTAADFHDELGHKMTKISLFVELAKRTAPAQEALHTYLGQVSDQTQILSEGIRDFIWVLDPEKDSLMDAVLRLKDFGEELFAHTDTAFRTQGFSESLSDVRLPLQMRRHLVLIFKEAMNNSLKYAHASEVRLSSELINGHFLISCEDNGEGFEGGEKAKGGGYGLKNMISRAEQMAGELTIHSAPGEGTSILLEVPLPQMGD